MKQNTDWYVWLFITLLSLLIILTGCRTARQETRQPVEVLIIRDSTVISRIDSITIIPVERSMSVGLDSSHLETSLAVSDAWTDSTGLHHSLVNKPGIRKETKTEYIYIVKDSIHEKPQPYPVEVQVPAKIRPWQRILMTIGAATILFVAISFFRKLKP